MIIQRCEFLINRFLRFLHVLFAKMCTLFVLFFFAVKRPRYAAVFFTEESTTSIVPTTHLPESAEPGQDVQLNWDGESCPGKVIKLSGNVHFICKRISFHF